LMTDTPFPEERIPGLIDTVLGADA
jgi:hypothetical protein